MGVFVGGGDVGEGVKVAVVVGNRVAIGVDETAVGTG
jgi:hypothetical protein